MPDTGYNNLVSIALPGSRFKHIGFIAPSPGMLPRSVVR